MIGTPYVRRGRSWDNAKKAYVPGGKIILSDRTFCVEVEYNDVCSLTPDEARYVATELWKLAEQIDGKTKKTSAIAAIRKRTKQIAQEAKEEMSW